MQRRVAAADARKRAAQLLNHPFITPAQAVVVHNQIQGIEAWELASGHETSNLPSPSPQTPASTSISEEAPSKPAPSTRAPIHHSIEVVDAIDVAEN